MYAMTIAEYSHQFLAGLERHARPNTVSAYRSDLTLAAHYLTRPLDQISLNDVVVFLSVGDVSAATRARRAASLKQFFAWAVQQGLCTANPLASYRGQHHTRRLPRPIHSRRDLDALDAVMQQAPQPFRLIFTILRETGMRVGEVLALDVGDVVLARGREGLRIRAPKNGNERIAFLGSDFTPRSLRGLRAWLKTLHGQPPYTPLFCSNRGTRLTYAAIHYQWEQLCQRAGLMEADGTLRYTIHQLRHTRGSELVQQGQRLEIVQRVLGHCDIRSTQGYAELDDVQVREALARRTRNG
jgi:integrase/recombinase XerD